MSVMPNEMTARRAALVTRYKSLSRALRIMQHEAVRGLSEEAVDLVTAERDAVQSEIDAIDSGK